MALNKTYRLLSLNLLILLASTFCGQQTAYAADLWTQLLESPQSFTYIHSISNRDYDSWISKFLKSSSNEEMALANWIKEEAPRFLTIGQLDKPFEDLTASDIKDHRFYWNSKIYIAIKVKPSFHWIGLPQDYKEPSQQQQLSEFLNQDFDSLTVDNTGVEDSGGFSILFDEPTDFFRNNQLIGKRVGLFPVLYNLDAIERAILFIESKPGVTKKFEYSAPSSSCQQNFK